MKTLIILSSLFLGVSCSESFFSKKQSESFYAVKNPEDTGGTNGGSASGSTSGSSGGTTSGSTAGSTSGSSGGSTSGSTAGSTSGSSGGSTSGSAGGASGGTTGTPLVQVTENFIQKATQSKLDILWVVDNSGSMEDEQDDLAENFDIFIQDFIMKKTDFKMAITTTDPTTAAKGLMVPGSDTKLTSQTAQSNQNQFISDFKSLIKVGIRGSGNEQGLQAVQSFMGRYPTYLRPEAYLAIVYLSDEQDSSPGTTAAHLAYLKSLKSNAGLVKAYSIVDKNLSNTNSNITLGFDRYAKMSEGTGGIVADIEADFAASLSDMSDSLIKLLDSFALAATPAPGSLMVYVNEVLTTSYTFDAATRSIKFNANAIPANNAKIRVVYKK